jgi:predicted aspartyl protease
MHWTKYYDDECLIHYEAKLGRHMPSRPRHEKALNWGTITLAATRQGRHLKLTARVQGKLVYTIINSGATGNFISLDCMDRLGLRGVQKEKPKLISRLSGEELGPQILTVELGVITLVVKG